MAKKIVTRYTFDPANNSITIAGIHQLERILAITNVTAAQSIYMFNAPSMGATSHELVKPENETILGLEYDCSGMSETDDIQIFVETDYTVFEPSESLLDPVNKFRVSNPQNLIDTDFEYGLQPTKWETMELVNNIPAFYSNSADYIIPKIIAVNTISGSNSVTVISSEPHNISVGAPIDVRGLSDISAEGKFLINAVPDENSFVYKANRPSRETANLVTSYTTIIPGQFYTGSEIKYNDEQGIRTDGAANSTISFETDYNHGFTPNSSLYVTNSIAKQKYNISDLSATAPDSRPTLDPVDVNNISVSHNAALLETRQMTGTYALKIDASGIDGSGNLIWPENTINIGDVLLYSPPNGDSPINGLERFKPYYVKSKVGNALTLCETTNGNLNNAGIVMSGGTFNNGKHLFIHGQEIYRVFKRYRSYDTIFYYESSTSFRSHGYVSNSNGFSGYFGPSQTAPQHHLFVGLNTNMPTWAIDPRYTPYHDTSINSNFTTGGTGTVESLYNPLEDFSRWENVTHGKMNSSNYFNTDSLRIRYAGGYQYYSSYNNYFNGTFFYFPLIKDPEGDSVYFENHGLDKADGSTIQQVLGNVSWLQKVSNWNSTPQLISESNGSVGFQVISDNRFKLTKSGYSLQGLTSNSEFVANLLSPTKDTLYVPSNSLYDGQPITVSFNGTVPTVLSGDIQFSKDKLKDIYNIVKTKTVDIIENNITSDHIGLFYQNGTNIGRPYNSFNTTTAKGRQRFYHRRGSWYLSGYKGTVNNSIETPLESGEVVTDPFAGTPYGGDGYFFIVSPWASNGTSEYEIEILQIPEYGGPSGQKIYTFTNNSSYNYSNSGSVDNLKGDRDSNAFSSGNWKYTYSTHYTFPDGTHQGYLNIIAYLTNTTYTDYRSDWESDTDTQTRNIFGRAIAGANPTTGYYIKVTIPLASTASGFGLTSGSQYSANQMALDIITHTINTLSYPTFQGTTASAFAKPVDKNRIKLLSPEGAEYNFTNSGSGEVVIETDELIGGADGYYKITSTTDTSISMGTSIELPNRRLDITSFEQIVNGLVSIPNHKLVAGQTIDYTSTSGSISGLTSGTTYYASPVGPDEFGISTTYNDALAGNHIGISSTGVTAAFESPTISGIAEGLGTVDIIENSVIINGINTLFKSYFKPGDTIRIRNNIVQPNEFITATVATVVDDSQIVVQSPFTETITDTNYYTETKINVKPDGAYLHRPFDGGVEITAGTSPNSSIVRQTRKYFRYQSGKGIQVSLAINFKPSRVANRVNLSGGNVTVSTLQPHGIVAGNRVTIKGASDNAYNGNFDVISADTYSFTYTPDVTPGSSLAAGIITYNIENYANSAIRAGLFDYQNGMFFEYDGDQISAVRRSSTQQLPGTCKVSTGSNIVLGDNTSYIGQLNVNDYVVIRGSSYKITSVVSNTEIHIQPFYKGTSATNVIMTKTVDTRVPQGQWNIDNADGNGPSGYVLDPTKIQMAYIDYSWYGAGKIRFGFKDTYGHVRYMHEFIHNNIEEEAYMRSGNIPARYEIVNYGDPTYVPSLFHWGTSVIMDGKFDDDKAYLFSASSKDLTFSNGDSTTVQTSGASSLTRKWNRRQRSYDWYVKLPFSSTQASNFSSGIGLYTTNEMLNGDVIDYTDYSGSIFNVYIYITTSYYQPAVYPSIPAGTQIGIGAPPSGGNTKVDLTQPVPLISIRLAPSVDNNLTGVMGAREIINRMQLQLKSLGITLTHDCEVDLILNGSVDNLNFDNVNNPSLSELIKHNTGDQVIGGSLIFSFRASGGTNNEPTTSEYDLSQITDLGNSILGGDGVFPNGPDLLTIAIKPVDTTNISAASPLKVASRVTWTESQA